MTLLTTEIHNHSDPNRAVIVFAADRCISRNGRFDAARQKVFQIPGALAGVGYFGLAEVPNGNRCQPMATWLENYLRRAGSRDDLSGLAHELARELNSAVPEAWRRSQVSGFHIAGFDRRREVVFWYVRNVDDDRHTIFGEYRAREDFQARDAPRLEPGHYQIYRNGDIRAHVTTWEVIDHSLGTLLTLSDFRQLKTAEDYVGWVRFKMETIARFYERYCAVSIIGGPIDAFAITRSGLSSSV